MRYKNDQHAVFIQEHQIGEIESDTDSIPHLMALLNLIQPGIEEMNSDVNANSTLFVSTADNYKVRFSDRTGMIQNYATIIKFPVEFYTCGDLKYLFQIFGREGYSGHRCL